MSQDKDPNPIPVMGKNSHPHNLYGYEPLAFPSAPVYGGPVFPQEGTGYNPGPAGAPHLQPRQPSQDESGFPVMGENNPLHNVHGPPQQAGFAMAPPNYGQGGLPTYTWPYSTVAAYGQPGYGRERMGYNLGPYAWMPYTQGPLQRAAQVSPAGYHGEIPLCEKQSYDDGEYDEGDNEVEDCDEEDYEDNEYDNTAKGSQPFFRKLLMVLLVQHLVLFLFAIDNGAMGYMRKNLFSSTGFYVAFAVFSAMIVPSFRKRELNFAQFSIMTLSLSYMVGMMFSFNPSATVIMLISVIIVMVGITSV